MRRLSSVMKQYSGTPLDSPPLQQQPNGLKEEWPLMRSTKMYRSIGNFSGRSLLIKTWLFFLPNAHKWCKNKGFYQKIWAANPTKGVKMRVLSPKILVWSYKRSGLSWGVHLKKNVLSRSNCGPSRGVASHEDGLSRGRPLWSNVI